VPPALVAWYAWYSVYYRSTRRAMERIPSCPTRDRPSGKARPRPEETHRVPGTRIRDFGQIGNCTRWAVHVFLDVQRALASVPFRKLARQMQSPPAAKAAHAKHSRRGNSTLSTVGAR
jgi:hypothetical protein